MKNIGRKIVLLLAVMVLFSATLCEAAVQGFICYGNDPNHDQFNGECQVGAQEAQKKYGTELVLTSFISKEAEPTKGDIPQLKEKWDFVIGVGENFYDVLAKEARQHPRTKYILIDSNKDPKLNNFKAVHFNNRELGYVAGVLAASVSQTGTVGFVGGMKENPAIAEMLVGYNKGVLAINPQGVVLAKWVGSFNKPKKLTHLAENMYDKKADIIFVPAGNSSLGIFDAAKDSKKMFIGCDGDISKLAPQEAQQYVLASVTKRLEYSVLRNIQRVMEGNFLSGVDTQNFANKGIACVKGPVSDEIWEKPFQALLDFEAQVDLQQEDPSLQESSVKKS